MFNQVGGYLGNILIKVIVHNLELIGNRIIN